MKKIYIYFSLIFFSLEISAQCPIVSCPSVLTLTNCQYGQPITATSNYSANISSRWIGPGNIPLASSGTATSVIDINHVGTYTVEFKDNISNCVVTETINVNDVAGKPTLSLSASSFSMACTSSSVTVYGFGSSTNPPGGAIMYTVFLPGVYVVPNGSLSSISSYTIPNCGAWSFMAQSATSYCASSYSFFVTCSTLSPLPLIISGSNTVCLGSSVSYTASGVNQVWSNAATGSTMNVIPISNVVYTVSGMDINGCPSSGTTAVIVNTGCSDVWPGDANSDGLVDNLDVFEIGLASGNTGPSRNPGGNGFISQFATNWAGTVSTGKNQCHADCNGDGVVNVSDNTAITTNFMLGHAFKVQEETVINPQVNIRSQNVANAGIWNKAEIVLGDSLNSINQVYGIAFELNYDPAIIEIDSLKLIYKNSFLNSSTQNIEFQKGVASSAKLYAASVRTDGLNVSGVGEIADFYFKLKFGVPENSVLNLSISNAKKVDNFGVLTNLSVGSCSLLVDANVTELNGGRELKSGFRLFPNPTSGNFYYRSNSLVAVKYTICDLSGREMVEGEFGQSGMLDLSSFENGTYLLKIEDEKGTCVKKMLVNH